MIALLALATVLAQAGGGPTICSFDTAAHLRSDSVVIALGPGPRTGKPRDDLRAEYLDAAVVIREYFRPPEHIGLPLWARLVGDSSKAADTTDIPGHGLDGDVLFRLDQRGRLTQDGIAVETLAADLAASIRAAIRRADSAAAFAPPSARLLKDRGTIRLHFVTPRPGSSPVPMVLRLIIPAVHVDKEPRMSSSPLIRYPDNPRLAGVTGRVVVQFVVGSDGRPDMGTLTVLQGENRELVSSVLEAVPEMRFTPAVVDSCSLPVLLRVPVDFSIRR